MSLNWNSGNDLYIIVSHVGRYCLVLKAVSLWNTFSHCICDTTFVSSARLLSACAFLLCIAPQTLFVWVLMLTIFSRALWSPSRATAPLNSLTEMSYYTTWIHGTMKRHTNPFISLCALWTEWAEPILDSNERQKRGARNGRKSLNPHISLVAEMEGENWERLGAKRVEKNGLSCTVGRRGEMRGGRRV